MWEGGQARQMSTSCSVMRGASSSVNLSEMHTQLETSRDLTRMDCFGGRSDRRRWRGGMRGTRSQQGWSWQCHLGRMSSILQYQGTYSVLRYSSDRPMRWPQRGSAIPPSPVNPNRPIPDSHRLGSVSYPRAVVGSEDRTVAASPSGVVPVAG